MAIEKTQTQSVVSSGRSDDLDVIVRALARTAYLLTRYRRHDELSSAARVSLDRASVSILAELADSGTLRIGELAARLQVEGPHVTRQAQRLEKLGYAKRIPDPSDGRGQLVQLTSRGKKAVDRMHKASMQEVDAALAQWSPDDLHRLAGLLDRMVDDFFEFE